VDDLIEQRKADHLRLTAGEDVEALAAAGWDDIRLVHEALPELDQCAVDLAAPFLGAQLRAPLLIAGMTGGHRTAHEVNAVLARAAERGFRVQAAFEPEFYLGVKNAQRGRWEPADTAGIYAEVGFDLQDNFLTDMTRALRALGLQPEMVSHEGGPAQEEISIGRAQALQAADNQMKLRSGVRGVALQHGYYASFAPKPFPWTFGSGAHVQGRGRSAAGVHGG